MCSMRELLMAVLYVALALSPGNALFSIGDRAVVIRIDDIQDYGGPSPYAQPEKMVLQYHARNRIPALVSIIPTRFGEDPQLVDQVKEGLAQGTFTVATHGWHHDPFINLSRSMQVTEMAYGKSKLEKILGSPILAFVPPYNKFNQDTIYAMNKNGLTLMSSSVYQGDIPREEGGIAFLPQTVTTAVVVENDTWTELPVESVTQEIKDSWDSYGVAVIVIHPRQFLGNDSESRWLTYLGVLQWVNANQGRIIQFTPPATQPKNTNTLFDTNAFASSVVIFAGLTSTLLIAFNTSSRRHNRKSSGTPAGKLRSSGARYRSYMSSGLDRVRALARILLLSDEDERETSLPTQKGHPAIIGAASVLGIEKPHESVNNTMPRTDSVAFKSCRNPNPENATHSPAAPLLPAVSCGRCGRRISRDAQYCDVCGFRLDDGHEVHSRQVNSTISR